MAESTLPFGLERSTPLIFAHPARAAGSLVLATLVVVAMGCTGSSSSGSATQDGYFFDSIVAGLTVTIDGSDTLTGADGLFPYTAGDTVTLSLGDIEMGSTTLPVNGIVTPVETAQVATGLSDYSWRVCRLANLCGTNMPVLTNAELQSLAIILVLTAVDSDVNLSNGIQITQAQRDATAALTFAFDDPTLLSSLVIGNAWNSVGLNALLADIINPLRTAAGQSTLSTLNAASGLSHFLTQGGMLFAQLAGSYSGRWSSSDGVAYTIETVIAEDGTVRIDLYGDGAYLRTLGGSMTTTGNPLVGVITASWTSPLIIPNQITVNAEATPTGIVGTWQQNNNGVMTNGDIWANVGGEALIANAVLTVRFDDTVQAMRQYVDVSGAGNDDTVYPWKTDAGDLIAQLSVSVSSLQIITFDLYLDDVYDETLGCAVAAAAMSDPVPIQLEVSVVNNALICGNNLQ